MTMAGKAENHIELILFVDSLWGGGPSGQCDGHEIPKEDQRCPELGPNCAPQVSTPPNPPGIGGGLGACEISAGIRLSLLAASVYPRKLVVYWGVRASCDSFQLRHVEGISQLTMAREFKTICHRIDAVQHLERTSVVSRELPAERFQMSLVDSHTLSPGSN